MTELWFHLVYKNWGPIYFGRYNVQFSMTECKSYLGLTKLRSHLVSHHCLGPIYHDKAEVQFTMAEMSYYLLYESIGKIHIL